MVVLAEEAKHFQQRHFFDTTTRNGRSTVQVTEDRDEERAKS